MGGQEAIASGDREGGDDADDLEHGGAVLAGHTGVGVHGLKQLQEDARREERHSHR